MTAVSAWKQWHGLAFKFDCATQIRPAAVACSYQYVINSGRRSRRWQGTCGDEVAGSQLQLAASGQSEAHKILGGMGLGVAKGVDVGRHDAAISSHGYHLQAQSAGSSAHRARHSYNFS